jgi:hypothetical protein
MRKFLLDQRSVFSKAQGKWPMLLGMYIQGTRGPIAPQSHNSGSIMPF